jgi:hypothetical protein
MKKNYIALALGILLSLNLMVAPVGADTIKKSVGAINNGQKVYAPVSTIVQQMGGTIQRNEADKFSTFTINGKILRIDDQWSFAEVDGKFIPYETRVLGGFTIPVFKKPIIKDGNVYVPVDFLKSSVGLLLDVKDDKITFNAVGNGDSTTTVETVTVPSTSGTKPNSNVGAGNVETNRPATNTTPTTNTTTTPVVTPKPTPVVVTPKPTPVVVPKPTPVVKKTVYTGSTVKQKLYSLGFYSSSGDMYLNKYGKQGADQFDYIAFRVGSGSLDMGMSIFGSNPEVDQKLKTMFSWILPTKGGTLYSILDNPNCKSQTIKLDGRTVSIRVQSSAIDIDFGPIK